MSSSSKERNGVSESALPLLALLAGADAEAVVMTSAGTLTNCIEEPERALPLLALLAGGSSEGGGSGGKAAAASEEELRTLTTSCPLERLRLLEGEPL